MPTPFPPDSGPLSGAPMSRRAALGVLAAAVGGAVAGCTPGQQQHRARRRQRVEPKVDPDVSVAADALAEQKAVLELIEATQQRHKGLAKVLAPALATHKAHVAVLADAVPDDVNGNPSPSPSPSASRSRRIAVPGDQARALDKVVRAEQDLRTSTKRLAFNAESGAFARILGSMAAAAAQQAAVLPSSPVDGKGRS